MLTRTFFQANLGKMAIRAVVIAFRPLGSVLPQAACIPFQGKTTDFWEGLFSIPVSQNATLTIESDSQ
jgi:hypothetical protein